MNKIICFDLWKTLAKEPYSIADYWAPLLEKYGDRIDIKTLRRKVNDIPMKKNQPLEVSVREIMALCDIVDEPIADAVVTRWKDSCARAELYPEVLDCLDRLRAQGNLLGLITNTSSFGWESLNKKYQLDKKFDVVAKSFQLGLVKPDPRIFFWIEKECSAEPSQLCMVGDSYDSDIAPSRVRGWNAVQIVRDGVVIKKQDTKTIKTILELL